MLKLSHDDIVFIRKKKCSMFLFRNDIFCVLNFLRIEIKNKRVTSWKINIKKRIINLMSNVILLI